MFKVHWLSSGFFLEERRLSRWASFTSEKSNEEEEANAEVP